MGGHLPLFLAQGHEVRMQRDARCLIPLLRSLANSKNLLFYCLVRSPSKLEVSQWLH